MIRSFLMITSQKNTRFEPSYEDMFLMINEMKIYIQSGLLFVYIFTLYVFKKTNRKYIYKLAEMINKQRIYSIEIKQP